jgi:hypothetical protein
MSSFSTPFGLISDLITRSVVSLIQERLTSRKNFFKGEKLAVQAPEPEVKLALIAIRQINPCEHLSAEEEALLRGIGRKTFAKSKQANKV